MDSRKISNACLIIIDCDAHDSTQQWELCGYSRGDGKCRFEMDEDSAIVLSARGIKTGLEYRYYCVDVTAL